MRIVGKFFTAFVISLMSVPVVAQSTYPDRPVITARIIAQKLAEAWGVPVTIEDIPDSPTLFRN
jgi:hypothetical protein